MDSGMEEESPAPYSLALHVHWARCDRHVVLMDVRCNRDVALQSAESLASWVGGWPALAGGHRDRPPSVLASLLEQGLRVTDRRAGHPATPQRSEEPARALLEFDFDERPLLAVIERVRSRRVGREMRGGPVDWERARSLVRVFVHLPPLFYGTRGRPKIKTQSGELLEYACLEAWLACWRRQDSSGPRNLWQTVAQAAGIMDQNKQATRHGTLERRSARNARVAAWIALASLYVTPAAWAEGSVMQFNLPSEPLPQAILDFYRQSGVQAIYAATPQVLKLRTRAVSGRLESSVALARMLQGTGLTFTFDSPHSVIIRPAPARRAQASPPLPVVVAALPHQHPLTDKIAVRLRPVEVTGSLIRGVRSALAPLVYIRHAQLEQAAYPNVEQALYALPLVSLNGPREDLGIDNNDQYGAGINLRGLGVGATLVLVNGRRQPFGGFTGDFVDVSTIPWSAVRRIEVLPEGASALYGADAVAGVVNIIMRDNFTGAQSEARYGSAPDGRAEWMFAQLLGTRWRSGHAMFDYQYSDATPLAAAARPYAANADKTPYGGGNYDSYYTNPGNILDPSTLLPTYGIPAAHNGALTAAGLSTSINLQNLFTGLDIFPDRMAHEFYGSVSQRIGTLVDLFAQGRYAVRNTARGGLPDSQVLQVPPSNPFYVNPYPGVPFTLVAYNFMPLLGPTRFASNSRLYMGTAGATIRLGAHWQMTVSESGGKQSLVNNEYGVANPAALAAALADPNPATAFDPFTANAAVNAGIVPAISQNYTLHSISGIESTDLVANGPLLRLPAGEAKLAVGFERRTETLNVEVPDITGPLNAVHTQHDSRQVVSAFSELHVPLLGSGRDRRATPRLTLDVAARYDHYSDFGGTFNPTGRLQWTATQWLKLRASWGRSYRAPKLDDLYDTAQNISGMVVLPDPQSPGGRSLVLGEQGSNPNLRQETAQTWTAGLDVSPWRGARVSLTYYDIAYWNRIEQPAADDPFGILQHAAEWAAVINRNPTTAQIDAICNSAQFIGPVATCLASHPAAIIDLRLANLATTHTRGFDIDAREHLLTRWGHLALGLRGTDVLSFTQAVTPTSPAVSILDTAGNPLSLRLRGILSWSRHGGGEPGWSSALIVNYTGAYRNPASSIVPEVSAWTTLDVYLRYRLDPGRFGQTTVSLNAVNALNHDPPFVDNQFGYDIYNVQALGRVVSMQINQRW